MKNDREWKRLQELYASLDDAELSKLYEQKADLTEIAHEALTAEFHARRLTPDDAQAGISGGDTTDDAPMVVLWDFVIPSDANEALTLLEDNELFAELEPVPMRAQQSGRDVFWRLSVAEADRERAVHLLRKHKGLFPSPEETEQDGSQLPDEEDAFIVAEFHDEADAELASSALISAGVKFQKYEEQHDSQALWAFEVAQNDVDRAADAIEQALRGDTASSAEA